MAYVVAWLTSSPPLTRTPAYSARHSHQVSASWVTTMASGGTRRAAWVSSTFYDREIKLNTTGAELFNLGWANQSAVGLVCDGCGYVHTFVSGSVELWKPDGAYPSGG
jgi:hypothetical protein